jgi:hypothetical protein
MPRLHCPVKPRTTILVGCIVWAIEARTGAIESISNSLKVFPRHRHNLISHGVLGIVMIPCVA